MFNRSSHSGQSPRSLKNRLAFALAALPLAACFTAAQAALPYPPTKVCLDDTAQVACSSNPSLDRGAVKWHPGHYLAVYNNRLNFKWKNPSGAPTLIKGNPNFQGVLMTWDWAELEPRPGEYDFAEIFANLNEFRTWDPAPKMILNIQYRDFNTLKPQAMPAYVLDLKPSGVVIRDDDKPRLILALWRDNVRGHLKQMLTALSRAVNPVTGHTLDEDPLFGGIGFPETALGLGSVQVPDLDEPQDTPPGKANYVSALKDLLSHAQAAFPRSLVWQNVNFIQGSDAYMQHFVDWAAEAGIGLSGPDFSHPGYKTTAELAVYPGLTGARDLREALPLAREDQNSNMKRSLLCAKESVASIFDWLINDAAGPQLNYVFWGRRDDISACGNYWSFDNTSLPDERRIKQVVANKQAQANSARPSSL